MKECNFFTYTAPASKHAVINNMMRSLARN